MEELSKGNKRYRRREWWLCICYFTLVLIGILIHEINIEDTKKAIEYQGLNDHL